MSSLHQPCQRTSVGSQGRLDVTLTLSPATCLHTWWVDSWWLCSHSACPRGAVLGTTNSEMKEPDSDLPLATFQCSPKRPREMTPEVTPAPECCPWSVPVEASPTTPTPNTVNLHPFFSLPSNEQTYTVHRRSERVKQEECVGAWHSLTKPGESQGSRS